MHTSAFSLIWNIRQKKFASEKSWEIDNEGQESSRRLFLDLLFYLERKMIIFVFLEFFNSVFFYYFRRDLSNVLEAQNKTGRANNIHFKLEIK
jgi:hypothetical protein